MNYEAKPAKTMRRNTNVERLINPFQTPTSEQVNRNQNECWRIKGTESIYGIDSLGHMIGPLFNAT
jgi:hypothetical protein